MDLVVLGFRGRHCFRDVFLGTTAERVVRKGDRSVLVVRNRPEEAYRRVLVAVDFSPASAQLSAPSPVPPAVSPQTTLRHGNLTIDRQRHQVTVEGRKVDLTPTEFRLLAHLTENAHKVVSCSELVLAAHGYETSEDEARKVIRPHITNLRQKMGASLGTQSYILNVRGVGYVLAPDVEESAVNH